MAVANDSYQAGTAVHVVRLLDEAYQPNTNNLASFKVTDHKVLQRGNSFLPAHNGEALNSPVSAAPRAACRQRHEGRVSDAARAPLQHLWRKERVRQWHTHEAQQHRSDAAIQSRLLPFPPLQNDPPIFIRSQGDPGDLYECYYPPRAPSPHSTPPPPALMGSMEGERERKVKGAQGREGGGGGGPGREVWDELGRKSERRRGTGDGQESR